MTRSNLLDLGPSSAGLILSFYKGDHWDLATLREMCMHTWACLIFIAVYLSLELEIKNPQRHTKAYNFSGYKQNFGFS
jgi:hypothetical protein